MRALRMLTGVVAGIVLLGGCSRKPVETEKGLLLPAGDPQAGRAVFEKARCYTCHEVSGQSFPAPSLDRPVRLTQEQAGKPVGELAQSIVSPSHTISGFPSGVAEGGELSKMGDLNRVLTVQDVADLVAFIESIQGL
jgi:mono/diheme cytochrome c family protein